MNKEKQIEEMAKVIKSSLDGLGCGNFNFTGEEISTMFAKPFTTQATASRARGSGLNMEQYSSVPLAIGHELKNPTSAPTAERK